MKAAVLNALGRAARFFPRRGGGRIRSHRPRCALVLEALEDRCLLSAAALPGVSDWLAQFPDLATSSVAAAAGDHLFVLTRESRLIVLDASPADLLRPVSQTFFQGQPAALYLDGAQLTIVATFAAAGLANNASVPRVVVTEFDVSRPEYPIAEQATLLEGAYLGSRLVDHRVDVLVYNDAGTQMPSNLDPAGFANNVIPAFAVHWLEGTQVQTLIGSINLPTAALSPGGVIGLGSIVSFDAGGNWNGPLQTWAQWVAADSGRATPPQLPTSQELELDDLRFVVTPDGVRAYSAEEPEQLLAALSILIGGTATVSGNGPQGSQLSTASIPVDQAPRRLNNLYFLPSTVSFTTSVLTGLSSGASTGATVFVVQPSYNFSVQFIIALAADGQSVCRLAATISAAALGDAAAPLVPAPPATSTPDHVPFVNVLTWSPLHETLPALTMPNPVSSPGPTRELPNPPNALLGLVLSRGTAVSGAPSASGIQAAPVLGPAPVLLGLAGPRPSRFPTVSSGHQPALEADATPPNNSLTQQFTLEEIADRSEWLHGDGVAAAGATILTAPAATFSTTPLPVPQPTGGASNTIPTVRPPASTEPPTKRAGSIWQVWRAVTGIVALWTLSQLFPPTGPEPADRSGYRSRRRLSGFRD